MSTTEAADLTPTRLLRLDADERTARAIADILSETFDPDETAIAAFEAADGRTWRVEAYFAEAPDEDAVRDLVAGVTDAATAAALVFDDLGARDWVKASLDGLAPVLAGRFIVHGAHDRARIPPNAIGLEIEAALAFGTGHHGTTRGCLLALDDLLKRGTPRRIADIGTGTGVLAMAAARAVKRPVTASDIDPVAVETAAANARQNHALVRPFVAKGLHHPALAGPFDLVFANILLGPLVGLAGPIARASRRGTVLILSGLLSTHAHAAANAYAARGFRLVRRIPLDEWTTLVMRRP